MQDLLQTSSLTDLGEDAVSGVPWVQEYPGGWELAAGLKLVWP